MIGKHFSDSLHPFKSSVDRTASPYISRSGPTPGKLEWRVTVRRWVNFTDHTCGDTLIVRGFRGVGFHSPHKAMHKASAFLVR